MNEVGNELYVWLMQEGEKDLTKLKDITPLPHPSLPLHKVVFSMRGKL